MPHKSNFPHKLDDRGEQLLTVLVTLVAAIVVIAVRAPDKWFAAIFLTVVTFGGVTSYFKSRWSSNSFWMVVTSALLVHLLIVFVIFTTILRQVEDISLFVCVPIIFLESFILYHAVKILAQQPPKHR